MAVNAEQRTMMRRVLWSLWMIVGALAIAAVAVYFATRGSDEAAAPMVPVSTDAAATWAAMRKPAPAFSLEDENGRRFSLASLRGRPVVVTFIDPLCRDYCPTEARRLTDAAAALPAGQRPAIVAVSANPYGNAPHILREDRAKWKLPSSWRWGVGNERTLAGVWKAYKVDVLIQTKKIAGITVHQVAHTEAAYVIDRTGHQRALFLWPYDSAGVVRVLRGLPSAS
jgi:cytochrome oxidase Cu insertion factor (SCO1/SenC/PrrC family)